MATTYTTVVGVQNPWMTVITSLLFCHLLLHSIQLATMTSLRALMMSSSSISMENSSIHLTAQYPEVGPAVTVASMSSKYTLLRASTIFSFTSKSSTVVHISSCLTAKHQEDSVSTTNMITLVAILTMVNATSSTLQ